MSVAELKRACSASATVRFGFAAYMRASDPETIGVANEVPLISPYVAFGSATIISSAGAAISFPEP